MMDKPTFDYEAALHLEGYRLVAGVDEVGRGALAGPVMAAAVIFPPGARFAWLRRVRDSKQLRPRERERLFALVRRDGIAFGLGAVASTVIDEVGIAQATRVAMAQAVKALPSQPDYLLIDAFPLPEAGLPHQGIIRGDQLSISIACASIVAKVTRDLEMAKLDRAYPGYGLASHKGYGTRQHLECLHQLGPCAIHRRSFSPVEEITPE